VWIDPADDIPAHIRIAHPEWKPTRVGWCPVCSAKIEIQDDDARDLQRHIHENHPDWERWRKGETTKLSGIAHSMSPSSTGRSRLAQSASSSLPRRRPDAQGCEPRSPSHFRYRSGRTFMRGLSVRGRRSSIHISVKRLNGVVLAFVGVALLIVAIDLNFSLNAPHPANAQVVGVQFGGVLIPTETAILLQNMFFIIGTALIVLGAVIVVLGDSGSGKRVKQVKEMAECGNCKASVPDDAQVCPACGAEFA